MKAHLMALNYDINKQPLGKLAPSTITNGFNALKDLADVISNPDGDKAKELGGFQQACVQLTNRYYTYVVLFPKSPTRLTYRTG
jgi:poly [ADP-ribose] polymerase 2/3/4